MILASGIRVVSTKGTQRSIKIHIQRLSIFSSLPEIRPSVLGLLELALIKPEAVKYWIIFYAYLFLSHDFFFFFFWAALVSQKNQERTELSHTPRPLRPHSLPHDQHAPADGTSVTAGEPALAHCHHPGSPVHIRAHSGCWAFWGLDRQRRIGSDTAEAT